MLPFASADLREGVAGDAPRAATAQNRTEPAARPAASNLSIAAIVVGGMAVIAIVAAVVFLQTQHIRRGHDLEKPSSPDRVVVAIKQNQWVFALAILWVSGLLYLLVRERFRPDEATAETRYFRPRFLIISIGISSAIIFFFALLLLREGKRLVSQPELPPAAVHRTPPAELSALGYLAPDTEVVAAIHVAEALEDPAGRDLLTRPGFYPAEFVTNNVTHGTGITLEDIDHAVLGVKLENRLPAAVAMIVQLRRPYDKEKLIAGLKAGRFFHRNKRPLYRFRLNQPGQEAVLWCASERAFVVGLKSEDLDRMPFTPAGGIDGLPADLRSFIKDRIGRVGQFWTAGHVENWGKTVVPLLMGSVPKEYGQLLKKTRTFGAWVTLEREVTVNAAVECADEPAAKELHRVLVKAIMDLKPKEKLAADAPPEADTTLRELLQAFTSDQHDTWVTFQAKTSADGVRKAFLASEK